MAFPAQPSRWLKCALYLLVTTIVPAFGDPEPLSIPPSEYWDGNDGHWSTFHVQIGSPGQTVRLIPGTSPSAGAATWVVIPEGCSQANPNLTDCREARGDLFFSNTSTSWSTQGLANGPGGALFNLITYEESKLGLSGNAYYGFDSIALGVPGSGLPTIEHQVIAGYATNDFWLGSLGLSPIPFNFTTLNDPQPSLIGSLRNQSIIPSSTWAYTAGAHYHDPPVYGSLTLGGYDSNRVDPEAGNITVPFGADNSRDLLVTLDSISYDTVGSSPLLASGISIFINSLIAEMWLPWTVCRAFEQAFSLEWDDAAEMYLLDEDTHEALLAGNPTFTFTFSEPSSSETVDITLPYAALDLEATAPLVNSSTRYFPLKQAQNETQYTLGRVFLQQAYVIADYDRREFQLAQAAFPSTSEGSNILPLYALGHESNGADSSESPESSTEEANDEGISGGTIGGIVVGIVVGIALGAGGAFWYFRRKRRATPAAKLPATDVETAEKRAGGRSSQEPAEVNGFGFAEMDSKNYHHTNEMDGKDGRLGASEMDGKDGRMGATEMDGKDGRLGASELATSAQRLELQAQEQKARREWSEPQEMPGSTPEPVELASSPRERR